MTCEPRVPRAPQLLLKFSPANAYDESVDCTLPHPLMLVMAAFMAVRFQYLSPGHQ